jgi:hypothetical protein
MRPKRLAPAEALTELKGGIRPTIARALQGFPDQIPETSLGPGKGFSAWIACGPASDNGMGGHAHAKWRSIEWLIWAALTKIERGFSILFPIVTRYRTGGSIPCYLA